MDKLVISLVACAMLVACTLIVGCGPPALTCQTAPCNDNSAKTYQLCVNADSSQTFNFGGMSCHCPAASCQMCHDELTNYCEGGAGGTGGSGGGGDGSMGCSYTVSGAQTAMGGCAATVNVISGSSGVNFLLNDNSGLEFDAVLAGQTMLTAGTYTDSNVAPGYGAEFVPSPGVSYLLCSPGGPKCNDTHGNPIPPQGSFTLIVTDPGPSSSAPGATQWTAPQGTLTLTLPAQPNSAATGTVTVNITL